MDPFIRLTLLGRLVRNQGALSRGLHERQEFRRQDGSFWQLRTADWRRPPQFENLGSAGGLSSQAIRPDEHSKMARRMASLTHSVGSFGSGEISTLQPGSAARRALQIVAAGQQSTILDVTYSLFPNFWRVFGGACAESRKPRSPQEILVWSAVGSYNSQTMKRKQSGIAFERVFQH